MGRPGAVSCEALPAVQTPDWGGGGGRGTSSPGSWGSAGSLGLLTGGEGGGWWGSRTVKAGWEGWLVVPVFGFQLAEPNSFSKSLS